MYSNSRVPVSVSVAMSLRIMTSSCSCSCSCRTILYYLVSSGIVPSISTQGCQSLPFPPNYCILLPKNLESILERGRDLDPEPRACGVETRTVAFCVFVVCSGRSGRELVDNYLTVAVLWRGREQGRGTKGGEGKG
jgi:hypothetical protein